MKKRMEKRMEKRQGFTVYKQRSYIIASIISLLVFLLIAIDLSYTRLLMTADSLISEKMVLIQNSTMNSIMIGLTKIADFPLLLVLSAVFLAIIGISSRNKISDSLLLIVSLVGSFLLGYFAKIIIQKERPENALIEASGFSFPSGHALRALIFFGLLIYLFKDEIKSKVLKQLFIAVNVVLILLIGFSRIYLNVHWLSDVIAGYALGLFWLGLVVFAFRLKRD